MSDPAPALEVVGLRKRFGRSVAVDGVSFAVGPSEIVSLVGPSGCGKSTVLRMVAGLQQPDEGTVRLGGTVLDGDGRRVPAEQRRIGIVFQDHALFPNLTVAANVRFGLTGRRPAEVRDRLDAMLALVHLDGYGDRYPHELSGGERQRVALARALAPEPGVLLLDEPFASLDHNLRIRVRAEIAAILRDAGTPAVFVTHDRVEALALGDRVVVMDGGRVLQDGTPDDVFHRPADRFVAEFLGEADLVPAVVTGTVVETELGCCPAPAGAAARTGGEAAMVVRPDDVAFDLAGPDADPATPGLAEVVAVEFQGTFLLYELRMASGRTVRVRRRHGERVEVGTVVRPRLLADATAALVWS